jgi:hypothetical protein
VRFVGPQIPAIHFRFFAIRCNEIRQHVEAWRGFSNPELWQVTPETARLPRHSRHHQFGSVRLFFFQIEAVEKAVWLTEVAAKLRARGTQFLDHLRGANAEANPELLQMALELATGAGKTTVMEMVRGRQHDEMGIVGVLAPLCLPMSTCFGSLIAY